jgi:hypothetical protein
MFADLVIVVFVQKKLKYSLKFMRILSTSTMVVEAPSLKQLKELQLLILDAEQVEMFISHQH